MSLGTRKLKGGCYAGLSTEDEQELYEERGKEGGKRNTEMKH